MPPIREYLCGYCGHQFDTVKYSTDPDDYRYTKCRCGSSAEVLPSMIGGYSGNTGGGSTSPKSSGSLKKKKAYVGPYNEDGSPKQKEEEQLEMDFSEKGE